MKTSFTTLFLVLIFAFGINAKNYGQNLATGYWALSSPSKLKGQALQNKKLPTEYKIFALSSIPLRKTLKNAPSEESVSKLKSAYTILLPNSDGLLKEFRVVEAPVMDPGLAAKYPEIKSYAASSTDDPSVTARFDVSPDGFHGIIFSEKGSDYIDPLEGGNYMVYSKNAMSSSDEHFACLLTLNQAAVKNTSNLKSADDGMLRKFRLALACTGEYSQYFLNGTETTDAQRKAKVLAAMNTTMTRVNGVFEKDFCLRLVIIANNDAIIYLDAATDPWTTEYNSKTQSTIDAVIGSANYDIGHLVMKGTDNGNAGCIGCVCTSGSKGSGFTSHTAPLADPFDIDYVAHEMGHQLGANHTFTFRNEGTIAQMEPGSGSTIMGYAGITGSTDVQAHSDDYFHAISIQQVTSFIKSASCVQASATGNNTPTASAGLDYTIPKSTPFELTGDGSDTDASDALTFCWEQIDNWTSMSSTMPSETVTSGPVFRSYKPVTSKTRVFPNLATILSGNTANTWEAIPSVARTLNFRLTVRDNHTGGGSNQSDDTKVTVSSDAGPFAITAPNTAVTWNGGTAQTVTWNVASTTASPVSCSAVNILLSTDGGQTFPYILAANVANDGSENIVVSNTPGTKCRIKVKAANNIFFDISNADFTIAAGNTTPVSVTGVSLSPSTLALTTGQTSVLVTTVSPSNATNKNVSWASSNSGVATVNASGAVTAVAAGSATITVTTQDGNKTATCAVVVSASSTTNLALNKTAISSSYETLDGADLSAYYATDGNYSTRWSSAHSDPQWIYVDLGAICSVTRVKLSWEYSYATSYKIQVSPDASTWADVYNTTTSDGGTDDLSIATTNCRYVRMYGTVRGTFYGYSLYEFEVYGNVSSTIPVTGVFLNQSSLSLAPNQTSTLTATVSPSNATNKTVTWSSNNTSVARVSSSGVVTAVAAGSATITVTTADGSKTATCAINVTVPVTGVTLTPSSLSLPFGQSATLTATVLPSNATNKNVTWSSSAIDAVNFESPGVITAHAIGSATITVTTEDGAKTATCLVTVTNSGVSYCTPTVNSSGQWIGLVKIGSINNATSTGTGYSDYTSMSTNMALGSAQSINLVSGWATGSTAWKVWIDFNHNGSFTDSGEAVVDGLFTGSNINTSFTVPATATLGTTRMRVMMVNINGTVTPCSLGDGEVEDYTVNITSAARNAVAEGTGTLLSQPGADDPAPAVSVFPNPASDKLFVSVSGAGKVTRVSVIGTSGKMVPAKFDAGNHCIDVSSLANGMYIVVVDTETGVYRSKFNKQ